MNAGGRGKSTLAKVLFNRLAGSFPHSAFVEIQEGDGADKSAHHLAAALKALGALIGASGEAAEGAAVLSSRLKGYVRDKKVLLVLDNVWTAGQLTALLPTAWGEGSTVVVTSRCARFTDSDAWRKVGASKNSYWICDSTMRLCLHVFMPVARLRKVYVHVVHGSICFLESGIVWC
jgi:phosphoribosylpyrophosphate synthetase